MAAGGRALLGASMLLCLLQPRSASGEPRGHSGVGPSTALQPGGIAASSNVAAASNPGLQGPSPPTSSSATASSSSPPLSAQPAARGSGKEVRATGPALPSRPQPLGRSCGGHAGATVTRGEDGRKF